TFRPREPAVAGGGGVGLEADHEAVLGAAGVKGEIPAEVLLPRLVGRPVAPGPQLADEPAAQVVAEAAVVDEVVLRLGAVERGGAECDFRLHGGHPRAVRPMSAGRAGHPAQPTKIPPANAGSKALKLVNTDRSVPL